MSQKVLCVFAEGFEEVEALVPCNLLKRAGCEVLMLGLDERSVTSARGVILQMNGLLEEHLEDEFDLLILPGGQPGADHLVQSKVLKDFTRKHFGAGHLLGAICATPAVVLEPWGITEGRRVSCFPPLKDKIVHGCYLDQDAVRHDNLITGQGVGKSFEFGFVLVRALLGEQAAQELALETVYS